MEPTSKNIVICCDGTSNEFGRRNTNVVRLFQMLERDAGQIAFYDPGLGTLGAVGAFSRLGQWWTKVLGLALGYGLAAKVAEPYRYLMEHYEAGDRVYLFGFSRGAYTVRALAAAIKLYGLLEADRANLIPYLTKLFLAKWDGDAANPNFKVAAEFRKTFARDCRIHFCGVWDTVNSVGWFTDPVKLPYSARNDAIGLFRHAISIDERKAFFRQNRWINSYPVKGADQTDVKEVWFAGGHGDVGGGYADEEDTKLHKVALEWMLREAEAAGLRVDAGRKARQLGRAGGGILPPDPLGRIHTGIEGAWNLLEWLPKPSYDWETGRTRWRINRGRPRRMLEGDRVHRSVLTRRDHAASGYRPPNLPAQYEVED
jgi:uncharacterized protein (DUF2235 family)